MTQKRLIAGLLLLVALMPARSVLAQNETPSIVRGYLFYSDSCPDCQEVRLNVMPPLYQQYGQWLQILAIDTSQDELNQQWLSACRQSYGLGSSTTDVPVVFIGDQALVGPEEIKSDLPGIVANLVTAGAEFPDVPRPGAPLRPTARFMFFFSPSCSVCGAVEQDVFPEIKKKYGSQVQWEAYDVTQQANYLALLSLGQLARLPADRTGAVPVIFVGDEYTMYSLLVGGNEIPTYLESVIDWFLAVGGVDLPGWKDELFQLVLTPSPQPSISGDEATATPMATSTAPPETPMAPSVSPTADGAPIHMAYFAEVGCSECDRVSLALDHLQKQFPALVISKFDIIHDLSINLCLSERMNVPPDQRHDAPAVFVGRDYLVDTDIQYDAMIQMVARYAETGAEASWQNCSRDIALPPPPPWWAVILPGLVDGINPCAFATIIFFVSYLSIIRRRGRDIIMVGASFSLAVFLSYLGFGMVLRELFAGLIGLVGPILRPILNILTAVVCLVLAALSLGDFRKARRGDVKDMALQLPHKLRMWINASIRQSMRAEALVAASFVSGVVVSFVELACTGQVYVPIIQGLGNPAYRLQSTLDLVVYCLAFVAPLVVVFILSYMGTTSKQLTDVFARYAAPVKLVMTVLFLGIGLWLLYDVLRIWGVFGPMLVAAFSQGA